MSTKTRKKPAATSAAKVWGWTSESLVKAHLQNDRKDGQKSARVHVQLSKKAAPAMRTVERDDGVEIFINPSAVIETEGDARLKANSFVRVRDAVGASLGALEKMEIGFAEYEFELDSDNLEAALVGLEIALYRFKRVMKGENAKIGLSLNNRGKAISDSTVVNASVRGQAVNLARHLVNLPPNFLTPVSYAKAVHSLLGAGKSVKVEVWDEARLAKEQMGLHLGVGQASATPPRLVHIKYRPPGSAKKTPIAFVGKGITFDSGGLDIKPANGMRLMKKDMGGSAAVLGVAYWAMRTQPKQPMDFYLALAENAISGSSFRPSDILIARNGQSVEIHNTDAEGRLVLADAMDVAITQTEKPRFLVDVATLTGAIKVALGSQLAGLFSNDAKLAASISAAGQQVGDMSWIMPLFQKYRSQLNSPFADQVNSADGFGGAITAALFLEKFAGDVPWAHLDIYAWKDGGDGAWMEAGGSGQAVLGLVNWIENLR
jgi:leucyl aminopeptidase